MTSTSTAPGRRAQSTSPRRGLVSQTLLLAFSTGVGQVIVAGLYIWTARLVGPDDFGPAVAAIGIGSTIAGFLDFGSNNLWVREVAASRLGLAAVGRRLCSKLFFSTIAISIWALAFLLLSPSSLLWIAAPIAVSLVLSQSFTVPLRAAGRSDLVAVSMLTDRLVAGAGFAAMQLAGVPPTTALWLAMTTGPIAATVVSRKILIRSDRPVLSLDLRTNPWRGSGFYGLSSAAASAQSLDLTIMNAVGGPAVAGLYGAVNRWTQPMRILAGAFTISASSTRRPSFVVGGCTATGKAKRLAPGRFCAHVYFCSGHGGTRCCNTCWQRVRRLGVGSKNFGARYDRNCAKPAARSFFASPG